MALSGRIDGSVSNLSNYFSFYAEWTATQSIADNASFVTVSTYWATTNTLRTFDTSSSRTATITINGSATSISKRFICNPWPANGVYLVQTVESFRINHNNDGTAPSVTISATADGTASTFGPSSSSLSGTISDLDTIPRYATVTQTLDAKTETTITIRWATDATVDKLWYSSNNGSSWTAVSIADSVSGSFTISGLSANTSYNIKTRVRRKDSQLNSDSSALSVSTYDWPYATTTPNFTIGDLLTIGLYNPLGRAVTITMTGADNSTKALGDTYTGTSVKGFRTTAWKSFWYASIPNAQSGIYKVSVSYDNHVSLKTGGRYSVNQSECLPEIGSVNYNDSNITTVGITGDSSKIIRNKSVVAYSASGLTAKNSATIASCSVSVNGNSYNLTVSGTSATGFGSTIDSAMDVTATFTVADSRGLTATKDITITMLDWTLPSAIITLGRQSNYYSETDIKVDADYSYLDGNNTITITYKARKQGTSSWTVTGTLSDNVQATFTADNKFKWDVQVTLVDRLGGTTTYNLSLNRGLPLIYFDTLLNSVGVNGFPVNDDSFEVLGLSVLSDDRKLVDTISTASVTLPDQSGHILRLSYNGAITVNIPDDLPIGYHTILSLAFTGANVTLACTNSGLTIAGKSAVLTSYLIPYGYSMVHLIKVASNRWTLINASDAFYTAGDQITESNVVNANGWVTSSQTNLQMFIPLAKPIVGATAGSLDSLSGAVRSALGGYVQYYDGTTYTNLSSGSITYDSATVTLHSDMVELLLSCTKKWGRSSTTITNNSMVSALFSALTITLS